MKALILTRFDPLIGANIFIKYPDSFEDEELLDIPTLMSISSENFFIHTFKTFKSGNLLFKIPNDNARGRVEKLLISIIIDLDSGLNTKVAQELLHDYVQVLLEIEDLYKVFDYEPKDFKGDPQKLKIVKELHTTFYKTIKPIIEALEISEQKLNQRVKELTCLYGLSKLFEKDEFNLDAICSRTLELLKPTWQSPDLTCARIIYKDKEYRTDNFKITNYNLAIIKEIAENVLTIQLNYFDKKQYIKDEYDFLNDVGNRLKILIEQVEGKKAVKQSLETTEQIIESLPMGILLIGYDKKIQFANKKALKIMGLKNKEDVIGKICYNTVCRSKKDYCPVLDSGKEFVNTESHMINKDGKEIQILKSILFINMNNVNLLLETIVDISHLKK